METGKIEVIDQVQNYINSLDFLYMSSYADTFVIKLPLRAAHSNLPIRVDDFARSLYESFVFRSFEKPLLKLAFSLKEPSLEHIQFGPGDKVLLWTVTERTSNEIVLEWKSGGFRGCTWFHVSPDQRHLMFGSSIGYWKTLYKTKYHTDVSPLQLLLSSVDQLKNNPYEQNLGERLLQSFQRTGFASVIGVHQLYSRLLLQSALKALVLEASS